MHSCEVERTEPPPHAVSLVVDKCDKSSSHLLVRNVLKNKMAATPKQQDGSRPSFRSRDTTSWILDQDFKYNYTVCVTPLNYNYRDVEQLVEMIEVNRMLGADHLVFYNYESSDVVKPYFEYYADKGVELLPWALPVPVDVWPRKPGHIPQIHYFAQLVATNDCIYRSMLNSRYVVVTDLDEHIVARTEDTWDAMMQKLNQQSNIGSWMFRNTFFRNDWEDDESADPRAKEFKLRTILKTHREGTIFPASSRSKLIIRPLSIAYSGIHFVYKHLQGFATQNVEPDIALLHHYRIGFGDKEEGMDQRQEDRRMTKYQKQLINRVKKTYDAVKKS